MPHGPGAKRTVKRYQRIQSLLGDHQDTVVATQALTAGTTAGESCFSYGMLCAREQHIPRQCRHDVLLLV